MLKALDICIPVYNESIRDVLAVLNHQKKRIPGLTIEIFLIDDASPDLTIREENRVAANKYGAKYIQHELNAGRSKTRNAFLSCTSAPWLLFLDGDSMPIYGSFLSTYLQYLDDHPTSKIVYGGTAYPEQVEVSFALHHAYAIDREAVPIEKRKKNPVASFHANNFVIRRDLLEKHPFEERLTQYGHEDSLLAIRLALQGIEVQHLNNPVQHLGLVENTIFLKKTQQAIRHLPQINQFLPAGSLVKYSSLWYWYKKCYPWYFSGIFGDLSRYWLRQCEERMRAGRYNSKQFSLYKLLYLLHLPKAHHNKSRGTY
jgi:glycosyltransferase involved in cell wall biosynthesis